MSLIWHDLIVSAGASGAIFGLYGVFIALLTTNLIDKKNKSGILTSILIFVGYNLLLGLRGGVDNAAHVGGLISGLILGFSLYPGLSNPKEKVKALLIPGLMLVFILSCGFIVFKSPKKSVIYDTQLAEFVKIEQEALSVYSQYITQANHDAIEKDGIPNWQKCKDIIHKLDDMPGFSDEIYDRNSLLLRYCDYRIASYKLIIQASEARTPLLFKKIEAYNKAIGYIMKKLKGEVIADNLLKYKAPVMPKYIKSGPLKNLSMTQPPMYIVDGKIVKDMSHIDPESVKEVNVLKGAAAKAVYGSLGQNGVMIITTK